MKKSFILSLLLALCCSLQCWAEFNPTPGKMYALKEKSTGLYLDIQTLGIHESGHTTNSMSLNANPRLIYFEAGATAGTWCLKNGNGTYGSNFTSGRDWNTTISETPYDWIFAEETEGLTISKSSKNYIGWDNGKTIVAGSALYNNAEGGNNKASRIYFALEDFTGVNITGAGTEGSIDIKNIGGWTTVPAGTGWTISMNVENPDGASFNKWGSSIFAIGSEAFPERDGYRGLQFYLQSSTNGGKLNAVFNGGDHTIDNVTYTGNFSASISYNGDKLLQIKTTNASGTVAVNDYTLNNTLAEFSQLSYGLPTGINIKNLILAPLSNSVDYPTEATVSDGKYTFKSNKILYPGTCNTIRFTLTQSGAFYKNGKNRMSFDSFELFDANGDKVDLKETYFKGNYNKSYTGLLDGLNAGKEGVGCCCGAWSADDEGHDYFEITLPNTIDLGGAFSFSFVTENTTMNAKAFNIEMSYVAPKDYTFQISGNGENEVVVTHNEESLTAGATINITDFNADNVTATEIPGYTWKVVVNEDDATVTLVYTSVEIIDNPAAVVALANRIGGEGAADKFKFVLDPSLNSKQEVFVLGAEGEKILIKGTTISAITTGLGWYLNHIAKINIAWNSLNEKTVSGAAYADLSNLPLPATAETHVSDAKYRYYLNTCTFGYSMTSWTWKRWQQEIDWMALHGINMPLQLVGMEEVWRKFLTMEEGGKRKYGYTDAEAKAFVAGPAFIAWWAMNNLEGWGGTAAGSKSGYNNLAGAGGVQDDAWYARQKKLAKQIVDAQRALGMQPVLPGWSGMVPTNFASKSGYATRGNGGNWAGDFVRPLLLNVNIGADKYAAIAADYYTCLKEVMGESQYYSMDPFHEGGGAGTAEDYQALYAAMEAAKPNSQWVIQQWQWSPTQKLSLTNVPEGRLIVLDLFSDGSPAFDGYNGYAPQDAVFCAIPNFGGRSGLMGRLQNVTDNYFKFKSKYTSIKGIGTAPEAIEQTPVTYDLIYQLPWMNGQKPDVAAWVDNYAEARYGQDNKVIKEAWSLLRQGPLNYGADGIQGPVEDVWAARPNLDANKASSWGKTLADAGSTYTPARRQMLIDAVYKLLDQEDALDLTEGSVYASNYNYDLVEFGGGVMADYAYDLLLGIKAAKNASNTALYEARRDAFLQLILDMDAFRGTNLNFRLGKWTQEARAAAGEVEGATSATADWYEYNNARTILTTWSSPGTNLTDYSYRSWQGLLKDYYYKRWKYYFDNNCTNGEYQYFEWNWAHGKEHYVGQTGFSNVDLTADQDGHTSKYTREPVGNTVEEAKSMLGKYIIPVTMADGTHYAYRYLTNDLSNKVTIIATGSTIDLAQYFGALEGATVTGDFMDGSATDLQNISLKSNLADGAYTGTITLADGTVLTFGVSVNPKYNGTYKIKFNDSDVFIQYNEGGDNGGSVGYKVMGATGFGETGNEVATGCKADYEADKIFTITPSGTGFTLSAQGQYLKTTASSGWAHIMFSEQKGDAGTYLINEAGKLVTLKSTNTQGMASVTIFGNGAWGNDVDGKAKQFTLEEVTTYPITVTSAGMATLCLPFNVVMANGMYAYDLALEGINQEGNNEIYNCTMRAIAGPGQTLKAGTPVIIGANEGDYELAITMDNNKARTSLNGSLLKGNFVKQTLTQNDDKVKFIFAKKDKVGFYRLSSNRPSEIGANKCWLEWDVATLGNPAQTIRLAFDDVTEITQVDGSNMPVVIYNLQGIRIKAPQPGLNIINGKKVFIKK